jgi:hypothetical protein
MRLPRIGRAQCRGAFEEEGQPMKPLLRIVLVGMALMLFSEMALAVWIRGGVSCGAWVEAREKEKKGDEFDSWTAKRWLVGFLSGFAYGENKEFWGAPNVDSLNSETVYLWIDNYCQANRLNEIGDGAETLFEVRTRKK